MVYTKVGIPSLNSSKKQLLKNTSLRSVVRASTAVTITLHKVAFRFIYSSFNIEMVQQYMYTVIRRGEGGGGRGEGGGEGGGGEGGGGEGGGGGRGRESGGGGD